MNAGCCKSAETERKIHYEISSRIPCDVQTRTTNIIYIRRGRERDTPNVQLSHLISTTETRFSSFGRLLSLSLLLLLLLWRLLFLLFSMILSFAVPFLWRTVYLCVWVCFFPVFFLHVYVLLLLCAIVIDGIPFIRVIRLVYRLSPPLTLALSFSQTMTGVSWVLLVLYTVFSSYIGNSTHSLIQSLIHTIHWKHSCQWGERRNIRINMCMWMR